MIKRGIITTISILLVLGILLGFSSTGIAEHNSAVVSFNPLFVYETASQEFNITINNLGSEDIVEEVNAEINGVEVTGVTDFNGWAENFTTSSVLWEDGTVETNVLQALFQFSANAGKVSADEIYTISVETTDDNGQTRLHEFEFTIRNDPTGPEFSNMHPEDGDMVAEGTGNYDVSVDAEDPETGVANVEFRYALCNETLSGNELDENDGTYTTTIDLSTYENEDVLCFEYHGTSNGDAESLYEGELTIDGLAPTVELIAPDDEGVINGEAELQFRADDNLAPVMTCELMADGDVALTINATDDEVTSIPAADAPEGTIVWSIRCTDLAGLVGESEERTYILDKTPPNATSNPEDESIIGQGDPIRFTITDDNGVSVVTVTVDNDTATVGELFELDTSAWEEGENNVIVYAEDLVGNSIEQTFTYIVDLTPPVVALVSPLDETDVHADFTFEVEDDYDNTLDCEVIVDGDVVAVGEVDSGGQATLSGLLDMLGMVTWNVECLDDAGNLGTSDTADIEVVDTSGPEIVFEEDEFETRSPIVINAEITDISGVAGVEGTLQDPTGNVVNAKLTSNGDTYTLTYGTTGGTMLGYYTATFTATDTLGYESVESQDYQLVEGQNNNGGGNSGGGSSSAESGRHDTDGTDYFSYDDSDDTVIIDSPGSGGDSGYDPGDGDSGYVMEEEPEEEEPETTTRKGRVIGSASSFFSFDTLKDPKFIWTIIILLVIMGILAMMARKPKEKKETPVSGPTIDDKLGLDDYLNSRVK